MTENIRKTCFICCYDDKEDSLYGEMLSNSKIGLDVHYYCLLSSYNIPQNGKDKQGLLGFLEEDIVKAAADFLEHKCFMCDKKSAAVKCCYPGCERFWHYPCGRASNCITQFVGTHDSYCNLHVPETNVIKHNGAYCYVCYSHIPEYHPASSIFSQCCYETYKDDPSDDIDEEWKRKFVCYRCVQRYASNAGYDAMCIWCSMNSMDKEEWQNQMRMKGIHVPMRMAAWESENHFKDHVKNKCTHPRCPIPSVTRNVWTCRVCGCHPRHLACAQVKHANDYLCPKCIDESFVQRVPFVH